MHKQKKRAFLKWAGGKFRLIEHIVASLPKAKTLVEPFVGAGSVFLNTDYEHYVLNDINQDLVNLYLILQKEPDQYIQEARALFRNEHNNADFYYSTREKFNRSEDTFERSVLFLYLNRYGYNGLCRYNRSGLFNVPFGRYKKPYFPESELRFFAEKSQRAEFSCLPFEQAMLAAEPESVVYCDPPYAPISETAYFTSYAANGFSLEEQTHLAQLARKLKQDKNLTTLISNHNTKLTRDIYSGAKIKKLKVARFISQKGHDRTKVSELLALF